MAGGYPAGRTTPLPGGEGEPAPTCHVSPETEGEQQQQADVKGAPPPATHHTSGGKAQP